MSTSEENISSDDELFNDDWMESIEKEATVYKKFFYTNTDKIQINTIYINRNNEIFDIHKNNHLIENNMLKREEILKLINKKSKLNKKKYRLLSILSYNFDLDNDEIQYYFKNTKNYKILKIHKNLNTITWNKSINYFKELNELYLVFIEKKNQERNKTRRIFIKHKKLKKTKKNRLK
tara:strand:- start:153 stop:686 length:534 start_codon:yes stop_codon:yes gene_type:complete